MSPGESTIRERSTGGTVGPAEESVIHLNVEATPPVCARVTMEQVLRDAITARERERERISGLFFPLAAALVALGGFVMFHMPPLDQGTAASLITFAALLYIPVDAAARAFIGLVRRPFLMQSRRADEDVLRRFKRLHDEWKTEHIGRAGAIFAYVISAAAAYVTLASTSDVWLTRLLWAAIVVFIISALLPLVEPPVKRKRRKRLKKVRDFALRVLHRALKWAKWPFIVGFMVVTLDAVSTNMERGRDAGVAVAGLVGVVLLVLTLIRLWHLMDADTSLDILRDAHYRLRIGEMTDSEAKGVVETVEILRQNDAFFDGDARSMRDLLLAD